MPTFSGAVGPFTFSIIYCVFHHYESFFTTDLPLRHRLSTNMALSQELVDKYPSLRKIDELGDDYEEAIDTTTLQARISD